MSIFKRKGKADRSATPPKAAPAKATPLNIAALSKLQLVMILAAAGGRITAVDIDRDLAAGAPANADGTFHLVHYTAWLASLAD